MLQLTPTAPPQYRQVTTEEIPYWEHEEDTPQDEPLNTPFIGEREDGSYFVDCYSVKEKQIAIYRRLLEQHLQLKGFFLFRIETYYHDFGKKGKGRLTFKVILLDF